MTVVLPPLVQRRSPNQSSRNGVAVTHLVWHATASHYGSAITWLCTPTIYNPDGSVKSGPNASAHLVLRGDGGECTQLVRLEAKAWHAEAWNPFSVGVEHASLGASFASSEQLRRSARVFGWLCHHLGVQPVYGLHRPSGIVRHRDLGVAGGNHSDGPSDQVWFHEYLPLVQHEYAGGGYRKTWAT